jgi:hypothetical protein
MIQAYSAMIRMISGGSVGIVLGGMMSRSRGREAGEEKYGRGEMMRGEERIGAKIMGGDEIIEKPQLMK